MKVKKKLSSGLVYFFFLAFMIMPSQIGGEVPVNSWYHEVDLTNMIYFALCLVVGFIPWLAFDKWIKGRRFYVPDSSVPAFKVMMSILIICSLYSIIYLSPFALKSVLLGASSVRESLYSGEGVLPKSILTTFAVAFAGLNIYAILLYFIACLNPALKKYRVMLIVSSLSYIFNCFAITARDGLIIVPCYYIVFYLVFKDSLDIKQSSKIRKQITKVCIFAAVFLFAFSLSRFFTGESNYNKLYSGTVGYISQQRYVFDCTIKGQDDFWGFEGRFPLVNRLMGVEEYKVNRTDNSFEWSFGTMYAEFYDSFAWEGLILFTLSFVLYYLISIKWLIRLNNTFGLLLMFCVYLFIAITGMFYFRAGSSVTINIFYLTLSIVPFFVSRLVKSSKIR